jgi:hypothetical protein
MTTVDERNGYWRQAMKRLSLLGLLAVGLSSCVARGYSTNNRADVILRIVKIQGQGSCADKTLSDFLNSDVLCKGGVINDNAVLSVQAIQKNPTTLDIGTANDIFLTSYSIQYLRSDGRNVEGVDVPYAITGSMSTLIPAGSPGATVSASIVAVRHQAKDEPPLKNLDFNAGSSGGDGAIVLTVTAQITIYGQTTSGKDVSAVGSLEITFADFGDTAS